MNELPDATEAITDDPRPAKLAAANAASDAGQWQLAIELWEALRREYPGDALHWRKTGQAYLSAGLLERSEEILAEAVRLFANDFWVAFHYTIVAQRRADWPEALRRAEELHQRFPDTASGRVLKGVALSALGRLDDAEATFGAAVERFPGDEGALLRYAEAAAGRQRWSEALQRWDAMLARFPHHRTALIGRARALRALHRPEEAEQADEGLREAVVREVRQEGIEARLAERVANPVVRIEITSICNFACTYCVSPMKLRPKNHMPLATFRRVIEQVAKITTNPIRLAVDGEPTNHPDFREMALLVNSYGLPIWLATNGSHLDPSYLDIWTDPLISMSTTPSELSQRHSKLDFDEYIDRIAAYTAAWASSQSRQNLFFQIIHFPQDDPADEPAYRERKDAFLVEFCRRAGLYDSCTELNSADDKTYKLSRKAHPGLVAFMKQPVTRGGLYPVDGKMVQRERATAGFCDSPWRQLVIHADGSLGACCTDLSGGTTFASAAEAAQTPLRELWEASPQITALRENFLHGRLERDVCQRCLNQGQVSFAAMHR